MRYYLVAILFIVFDLEIAFLFPWAVALGKIGALGLVAMMAGGGASYITATTVFADGGLMQSSLGL